MCTRHNNVKNRVPINALTAVEALMTLTDFTLFNARRFYSSIGNPLAVKGLKLLLFSLNNETPHYIVGQRLFRYR